MKRKLSMTRKVADYLAYRHALGYELKTESLALADFARYVDRNDRHGPLTLALALEWARLPTEAAPAYWARRLETVRGLAKFLKLEDPQTEVPPTRILGPSCQRKAPHIYSSEEIVKLMRKARCLPRRLHAPAISTVIGLLASTGMRVSEALRLQVEDVDWKERLIVVRESKFHKSRLIPLHPTVVAKLATYDRQQRRDFPLRTSFFVSKRGGPLTYGTVQRAFRELVKNQQSRGEHARPRLHDLRHTFACRMLTRWSKRPVILDQRVLWLMHYLGHTHVNHTYWYLSAVPELLAQAAVHFERHSGGSTS